jgi:hypothetical protein
MNSSGLVQAALFVAVLAALAILVKMDGGLGHEMAALDLPSIGGAAAHAKAQAQAKPPTGIGVTGAINGLNQTTSASMNRSMQTLEQRGR